MTDFSPREIVSELDRYIVGQHDAKRSVAIALRNRWRRMQLEGPMRDQIGFFECTSDGDRVVLLLHLLGRQVRCSVSSAAVAAPA